MLFLLATLTALRPLLLLSLKGVELKRRRSVLVSVTPNCLVLFGYNEFGMTCLFHDLTKNSPVARDKNTPSSTGW